MRGCACFHRASHGATSISATRQRAGILHDAEPIKTSFASQVTTCARRPKPQNCIVPRWDCAFSLQNCIVPRWDCAFSPQNCIVPRLDCAFSSQNCIVPRWDCAFSPRNCIVSRWDCTFPPRNCRVPRWDCAALVRSAHVCVVSLLFRLFSANQLVG